MKEFVEKLIGRLEEFKSEVDKTACKENKLLTMQKNLVISTAIDIINELAEEYNNGWISVKDRLPTEEGRYLVVGKTGGATVTRWYMPNKFHPQGHFGGNSAEYIRYWMPRPQAPYKAGD